MYGAEGHISFLSPPNGPVIAAVVGLPLPEHPFRIERARSETRLTPSSTPRQNTSKSSGKAVRGVSLQRDTASCSWSLSGFR